MYFFYMNRIIKSKLFYSSIVIMTIILLLGCSYELMIAKDNLISVLSCIGVTRSMGIFSVVAPALSSACFLFFFAEEINKKAIYYQILRTSRKKYYRSQIFCSIITAGLISGSSVLIFSIICTFCGAVWTDAGGFTWFDDTCLNQIVHSSSIWKLTLWYCVLLIMYCLPWALVGMVVSLFTKNKYVLIAAPFIIFMAWNYLTQLIYPHFYYILLILPTEPLMFSGLLHDKRWTVELTILYPIIYHIVLIGGLTVVYCVVTNKRFLREGL